MARTGNASAVLDARANTVAQGSTHSAAPANDGAATTHDVSADKPRYVLTTAIRKRLLARAIAMGPSDVVALPTYASERLDWVAEIQKTAWGDCDRIAGLVLCGKVVTVEQIDEMGYRVEFAREVFDAAIVNRVHDAVREASAEAAAEAKGDASVEQLSDTTLRTRMSACRVTLCDALKRNLPAGSSAMADVLRIRKDRRHARHAEHNRVLLAIFRDAELVRWLRALPKGEGAALDDLRALEAERKRRAELPVSTVDAQGMPLDLAERAFLLATESLADVLNAGRYLIDGVAARKGDYPGFRPPRRAKTAVATPAPAKPVTG
ncbi:MAG: hypothetical protein U0326_15815 [Polyangiales bacterium]